MQHSAILGGGHKRFRSYNKLAGESLGFNLLQGFSKEDERLGCVGSSAKAWWKPWHS